MFPSKDGNVVLYETKGSVRADADSGHTNNPHEVYDLKNGQCKIHG